MEFNRLIPELSADDFEKSLSFYTDVLGFQIEYQRPEHKFAFLSYQGSQIMLEQLNMNWKAGKVEYPFGRGINFQMLVDDIEVIISSLREHGYPLMVEPEKHWYRKDDLLVGQKNRILERAQVLQLRRDLVPSLNFNGPHPVNLYHRTVRFDDLTAAAQLMQGEEEKQRICSIVNQLAQQTMRGSISAHWFLPLDRISYAGIDVAADDAAEKLYVSAFPCGVPHPV